MELTRPRPKPRPLSLLLLLFILSPTAAQPSITVTPLPISAPLALPHTIPFASSLHYKFKTGRQTVVAIDWATDLSQTTTQSPDVVLAVRINARPTLPITTGLAQPPLVYTCSVFNPCFGLNDTRVDAQLFFTAAARGFLQISVPDRDALHVTVLNYDRGRRVGERPLQPQLQGTLFVRSVQGEACGGWTGSVECSAHGSCVDGVCVCEASWRGRFCDERVMNAPQTELRPVSASNVEPLGNSAIVQVVQAQSTIFRYEFEGDGSGVRVVFRARVLVGNMIVEGNVVSIGGGGSGASMFVKEAGFNGGEFLTTGTDMPSVYDEQSRGMTFVERQGEVAFYETLFVSDQVLGRKEWFMRLAANATQGAGNVVYSVRVRLCGGRRGVNGKCPFVEQNKSKVPEGVWIGVGAVVGVVVLVVVVMCMWRKFVGRRQKSGSGGQESGAWKDVEVSSSMVESSREISTSRDFTDSRSKDIESFTG